MRFITLTSLLSFVTAGQAYLFNNRDVFELNSKNFKREVLFNDNVTLAVFYAPWCGYCQKLAPEYSQAAAKLKDFARVVSINCDLAENKGLCAKYKIKGFPTIKVFQPEKKSDIDFKLVATGGVATRKPHRIYTYVDERSASKLVPFVLSKLRNYAATLDSDDSFIWFTKNGVPRVVILSGSKAKSKNVSPLLKVLSNEYFGKIRFAYIPRSESGKWKMLDLPASEEHQLYYLADDRPPQGYKGKFSKRTIKRFLDEQFELEMERRRLAGKSIYPKTEDAAHGLEFVKEDPQKLPMKHVEIRKKEETRRKQARAAAAEEAKIRKRANEIRSLKASEVAKVNEVPASVYEKSNCSTFKGRVPSAVHSTVEGASSTKARSDIVQAGIQTVDELVRSCIRLAPFCVILKTRNATLADDLRIASGARGALSSQQKASTQWQFINSDMSEEKDQLASALGIGESQSIFIVIDVLRAQIAHLAVPFSIQSVTSFVADCLQRKYKTENLAEKLVYWVLPEEIEEEYQARDEL